MTQRKIELSVCSIGQHSNRAYGPKDL